MLARFALAVERLARAGRPVSVIAAELNCVEDEVLEAMRLLDVPMPGNLEHGKSALTEAERAALVDRMPKKWQERYSKSKSGR
jgi:hypothetical protein